MKSLLVIIIAVCIQFSAQAALNITTYNIRMFDAKKQPTNKVELAKVLKRLDFDILTVEEIVNGSSFQSFIRKTFPGYKIVLTKCGGAGRQKIGFVYNPNKVTLNKSYEDKRLSSPGVIASDFKCGQLRPALVGMFTEIKTQNNFVVVGVHLKAGGRPDSYTKRAKQYKTLERMVKELKLANHKNVIVLGDFNTTGFSATDSDYVKFNDFLVNSSTDTLSNKLDCTSYWSGENRGDNLEESSILDHIVHTRSFLGYNKIDVKVASHCERVACEYAANTELGISYKEVSDHCPVVATFK